MSNVGTKVAYLNIFFVARELENHGPDFQKNLRKNPKFSLSFPKFFLSLSKVIKLRFSQNFKFNSLLQY